MKLTSLLLILGISFQLKAQNFAASTVSQYTNEALDIEIDASGNIYTTGYITGETAFNVNNVIPYALGNGDIYIAKYSSQGSLLWKKSFGGNYSDRAYDLAIGPDQSPVITGQYFGTVTFGNTTLTSTANSKDVFLLKLDPLGNVVWARSEGGSLQENAYGVTVDHANNVILTGQFQGNSTIANVNFTSAIDPNTSTFSFDFFVSKYTASGAPIWALNGMADYDDRGFAVAVDIQNNIFFTGQFSKTLVFAGNTYPNTGYNVGFVSKLNPAGQVQYFNFLRAGNVSPYDLEINALGDVLVTGDFGGNMNYYDNSGPHTIQNSFSKKLFVLKTSNSGAYNWNYTLGSENELSARSISIDQLNDVYVTGYFKCALSQIHDTATALFNSVGFKDPYLLKLNNMGTLKYIQQFGGKMNDQGHGVAIHDNNSPIVCGSYTADLNFPADGDNILSNNLTNLHKLQEANFSEPSFQYLIGDSSLNSFLMGGINSGNTYNYMSTQQLDTIVGEITSSINDSITFCHNGYVEYTPFTFYHYGPSYNYSWENGDTENPHLVNTSGWKYVLVTRSDECAVDQDSVYAKIIPRPFLPKLSDDVIINTQIEGPYYYTYSFCFPDTLGIFYTDIDTTSTITTVEPNGNVITGLGVNYHSLHGVYQVIADNQGCASLGTFEIQYDLQIPYDSIDLNIGVQGIPQFQDSIELCENEPIRFYGYDHFTNPNGLNISMNQPIYLTHYFINGNPLGGDSIYSNDYIPTASGWYQVDLQLTLGYNNLCGTDTTSFFATDSIYIHINPLPVANYFLFGDNLLCENGSIYIVTSQTYSSLNWNGPGLFTPTLNSDSIEVTTAGVYSYSGTIIDSISGCANYFIESHTVHLKTPPTIFTSSSNIICPYDTIMLHVPSYYVSYNWVGPNGNGISSSDSCQGFNQGFYYVHVIDTSGCSLTSPPFELIEYTTPSLQIAPDEILCENEVTTISVIHTGNCQINWSPLNSQSEEITVSQAGTYSVSILQCGITTVDSVVILDGSFQPTISIADSLICQSGSTVITGSVGNATYEWNNGQTSGISYPASTAGIYFATVTNEYGCTAPTDTVTLNYFPGSAAPTIEDQTVCAGNSVVFTDTSNFILNWYNPNDTMLIVSTHTFTLPSLTVDTSWLVTYLINGCPSNFSLVTAQVIEAPSDFQLLGDSSFCYGENAIFSISEPNTNGNWQIGDVTFYNQHSVSIPYFQLLNNSQIQATISNSCFSITKTDTLIFLNQENLQLTLESVFLCAYDAVSATTTVPIDNVIWTGNFGQIESDEIVIDASFGNGYVYANGIGTNGCPTTPDSLLVSTSDFSLTINQNIGNQCLGDSGTLTAVAFQVDSLQWSTPIGIQDTDLINITFSDTTAGWYTVNAWDLYGCSYSDSVFVQANQLPIFDLYTDTIVCIHDILTVYFPSDTNTYEWSTLGGSNSIPILENQELILTATSPAGCLYSDTLFVLTVDCENDLPNVITPNGDGTNDYFYIDDALAYTKNELFIFNRWGNIVAHYVGYDNTFTGENLIDGVYFYRFFPNPQVDTQNVRDGFLQLFH